MVGVVGWGKRSEGRAQALQHVGQVQAADFRNGMIAITLEQFSYLATEDLVIE